MELPFLKNKKNRGGGTTVEKTRDSDGNKVLTDSVVDELMSAAERKDIKAFREALRALVLTIKGEQ